jgi:phage terminase Nu1 subunit (DNA packaging protein)
MPEITQAQLAELLKVSEARVSQVKKTGRLDGTFQKRGRSVLFDQEAAIAAWNGEVAVSPTRKETSALEIPSFNESRAKSEHFRAELARLDLEVKEDQLVEVSRVQREAFSAARAVRDALGNIPDRVSNQMAAESDPVIIHQTLTDEIRKALETLTDA